MTDGFKFTIPVEKAETREDGLYLTGIASGLGLDTQGHEMDPEGIQRFAAQIAARAETGDHVPFVDWHQKDGIAVELGYVTKAEVDEDWNLHVEVKLDEENPLAVYMHKKAQKGKKYGMSVAGKATSWVTRFDEKLKRTVFRFKDIALREISATTRPIWTPSFGTVIAKSVIDAADAESVIPQGDEPEMSKDDTVELNVEATEEASPADEPVTEAPAEEAEAEATTEEVEEPAEEVEKAGARYSKSSKVKLLSMFREIERTLREEGILEDEEPENVEKSETADNNAEADTTTTETTDEPDSAEPGDKPADEAADAAADEKADEGQEPAVDVEALQRALAEMTARAEAAEAKLAEKEAAPRLVVKPETATTKDEDLRGELEKLAPADRLLAAFALRENARR